MEDDLISGACLCGNIHYTVRLPVIFCTHCHCRFCRKAQGAAFVTWFGVLKERILIEDRDGKIHWFAASNHSQRGFCGECGTTLFFTSSTCPGEIHVVRASTDADIGKSPSAHIFYDHRVGWVDANADELPTYDSDSDALAKFAVIDDPDFER